MKKRVLCIILTLLMVFPLVFAAFADTNVQVNGESHDRGNVSLNKTSDYDSITKEPSRTKGLLAEPERVVVPEDVDIIEQKNMAQLSSSVNDPKNRPRLLINLMEYEEYNRLYNTSISLENWGSSSDGINDAGLNYKGNDVAVFLPYDHVPGSENWYDDPEGEIPPRFFDEVFEYSYAGWGQKLADTIGGNCYVFTQSYVTPARIALALEKCKVVLYGGHGITFYNAWEDYVNLGGYGNPSDYPTSFLCMIDSSGKQYGVSGVDIANYMGLAENKPFFWMGACEGMKTNKLCQPLLNKGVEVVYGYTDTFWDSHDDACKNYFMTELLKGKTVEEAAPAFYAILDGLPDHVVWEGMEFEDAYPLIVSSVDPYPSSPELLSGWHLPKSQWRLYNPDDLPTSFVPENPITPEDADYRTSYYYNTGGTNPDYEFKSEHLQFVRFEWDSSGDKAYAFYLYQADKENMENVLKEGEDSWYLDDEGYFFGCKVEAAIVCDGNLKYAVVPYWKSPSKEDRSAGFTRAEYHKYTPGMYEKGWFFDHWKFVEKSGADPDAWVVYYNKWTGEEIELKASYSNKGGIKVAWVEDKAESHTPDGVTRYTRPGHSNCGDYWIYDGIDWNTNNYNPITEKGAKAIFKFHCAHGYGYNGCNYTEETPKKVYVDAVVTSKRNIDDDTYEVSFEAFISGQNWNSSKDHWDHYESTIVPFGPEATLTPTPAPTPTPHSTATPNPTSTHVHNWEFVGFNWDDVEYSVYEYVDPAELDSLYEYLGAESPVHWRRIKKNELNEKEIYVKAVFQCECGAQVMPFCEVQPLCSENYGFERFSLRYEASIYAESSIGMESPDYKDHSETKVLEPSYEWFFEGFEWDTTNDAKAYAVYHYGQTKIGSNNPNVNQSMTPSDEEIATWKQYDKWHMWDYCVHYYDTLLKIPAEVNQIDDSRLSSKSKYTATISGEESPNGYSYTETKKVGYGFSGSKLSREKCKIEIPPWKVLLPGPIKPIPGNPVFPQ